LSPLSLSINNNTINIYCDIRSLFFCPRLLVMLPYSDVCRCVTLGNQRSRPSPRRRNSDCGLLLRCRSDDLPTSAEALPCPCRCPYQLAIASSSVSVGAPCSGVTVTGVAPMSSPSPSSWQRRPEPPKSPPPTGPGSGVYGNQHGASQAHHHGGNKGDLHAPSQPSSTLLPYCRPPLPSISHRHLH